MFYAKYVKRLLSILLSVFALIISSPVLLTIAFLVKLKLGSPVIFAQDRPGYHEKIFRMYKFRTMTNEKDENGVLLPDEKRQTKFGHFLRKTSLDEIPEFVNILKGDMAFIGPRPLLIEYLSLYSQEQHKRHNVRPGMTNISAIKGRNSLDWIERLKLDTWYAENVSFRLDVGIFFRTIKVVLFRNGSPDAVDSSRGSLKDAITQYRQEGKHHNEIE